MIRKNIVALVLISVTSFASAAGNSPQIQVGAEDEKVWHWYSSCAGVVQIKLEVRVDHHDTYSTSFPVCLVRRAEIKPEPTQRILEFYFTEDHGHFGAQQRERIEGNLWEAGIENDVIMLGVSFATKTQVLENTLHFVDPGKESVSAPAPGIIIKTYPILGTKEKS